MARILILALTVAVMIAMAPGDIWAGLTASAKAPASLAEAERRRKTRPYEDARAQATDTVTAARALVPLLKGVRQRLRPHTGIVRGNPPDSPFTGTQTTIFSIGIGRKEQSIDPKVVEAMDRLSAWKMGPGDETPEALLFSHWLTELTLQASGIGILDCDATCVVARFTKPDAAFGKSRAEREATRDQMLLDALTDAVEEIEPR